MTTQTVSGSFIDKFDSHLYITNFTSPIHFISALRFGFRSSVNFVNDTLGIQDVSLQLVIRGGTTTEIGMELGFSIGSETTADVEEGLCHFIAVYVIVMYESVLSAESTLQYLALLVGCKLLSGNFLSLNCCS